MSLPDLIGLSGYGRSGKDSVAAVLAGYGYERVAFADILREFLYALNPDVPDTRLERFGKHTPLAVIVDALGWEHAKVTNPHIRALLQRVGTDCGRAILGENVWIDATFTRMDPLKRYCVTDMRFPNEAEAVRKRGGKTVRIIRPGFGPVTAEDGTVYKSETALDDWGFGTYVYNRGTLDDLAENVEGMLWEC